MNELTHLDLFSGIGGFALAAKWAGFRTIGFCEIDAYCQKIIAKNFLADAECSGCGDIRNLNGRDFAGVTLFTGGFPCQPFSVAGKRRGKEDDRHLWPEMLRVVSEARPAWVVGENVTGIIGMELDQVLSDLEAISYTTRTFVIPACGVDAPHRRNRVWIVAHAGRFNCERGSSECGGSEGAESCHRTARPGEHTIDVADAENKRLQGEWSSGEQESYTHGGQGLSVCCRWPDEGEWFAQSGMGRVAHGIPKRVDRLKGLGNAIVPQIAYQILKAIAEIELTRRTKIA